MPPSNFRIAKPKPRNGDSIRIIVSYNREPGFIGDPLRNIPV